MKLTLVRYSSGKNDTLGLLFLDGVFHSYTLEDEYRSEKVAGKTRIPNGTYQIVIRSFGGFHERYQKRFGIDFHKGMLELKDVPGFTDILIHCGNDHEDTAGCILLGDGVYTHRVSNGKLVKSGEAYVDLYQQVINELYLGKKVEIEITDDISNHLPKV